jgi:hypothetical protein
MAQPMPRGRRRVLVRYDVLTRGVFINGRYHGLDYDVRAEAATLIKREARRKRMARKQRRGWV